MLCVLGRALRGDTAVNHNLLFLVLVTVQLQDGVLKRAQVKLAWAKFLLSVGAFVLLIECLHIRARSIVSLDRCLLLFSLLRRLGLLLLAILLSRRCLGVSLFILGGSSLLFNLFLLLVFSCNGDVFLSNIKFNHGDVKDRVIMRATGSLCLFDCALRSGVDTVSYFLLGYFFNGEGLQRLRESLAVVISPAHSGAATKESSFKGVSFVENLTGLVLEAASTVSLSNDNVLILLSDSIDVMLLV